MRMKKKRIYFISFLCMLFVFCSPVIALAATGGCETYSGSNNEAQSYSRCTTPVKSYLTDCGNGTMMRVQAGNAIEGVLVEYYDSAYNLMSSRIIPQELAIFGGFYETESNYYLITGQNNPEESADVEVYRITKYDKSWNRISSAGLYDCNTTIPFGAGTVRVAQCRQYLLIRTSHQMYQSSDGKNHQANVTIELDAENMQITDSFTNVMNSQWGYVSHSFNQFIGVEDNHIVAVDHGDAYPRSIVLIKYSSDASGGHFSGSTCNAIDVMGFPGEIGDNVTGASVGGFEIANDNYLVAGNSVVQDDSNTSRSTRNVFVASVSKETSEVALHWLTSYEEGDGTTRTPQMMKLSENRYLVLWSRDDTVFYTEIDGSGTQMGEIYHMDGHLSDCKPLVSNGKIIWYVWNQEQVTFYDISLANLGQNNKTEITNGHQYENMGVTDGYASLVCRICGAQESMRVADVVSVYWNNDGGNRYSSVVESRQEIGERLYYTVGLGPEEANKEIEVIVSDPAIVTVSRNNSCNGTISADGRWGILDFKGRGEVTITFRPKYNPSVTKEYTFYVGINEPGEGGENGGAPASPARNGLCQTEDGNWYYYVNGGVNTDYTGLVQNEHGWWYVENGRINFDYNGLIYYGDAWWCVAGGKVCFDYTGLWYDPYVGWWYVENGRVNFDYDGLILYGDVWWCVAGGQVCFDYTGLWYDPYVGWWYVENGRINFGYDGLILYGDVWWCVAGGRVCFDYTGLWYDPYVGWWYVNGGGVDFGATGLVENEHGWWYVEHGGVNFGYTGLAYDANVGWWYVSGGSIDFNYNGYVDYNGGTYQVLGGKVV